MTAGIITLTDTRKNLLGKDFDTLIKKFSLNERLDIGCVLERGSFDIRYSKRKAPVICKQGKELALVSFLLSLLGRLQEVGTVAAMDISSYYKSIANS